MKYRSSGFIGGAIALCVAVLVFLSFDIAEYQNHHEKNIVVVSGEQQFIADITLRAGPASESWIEQMIDAAQERVWVGVYTFTVPNLREALLRAQQRGVDVRVILEKNPFGNTTINRESLQFFTQNKIRYHESTAKQFAFMHAKYAVIDTKWVIETANWTRASFSSNREFFMTGHDSGILHVLEDIFQKDFVGDRGTSHDTRILAGPTNARERLLDFLNLSKKTIDIYAPDFSDAAMIAALNGLCLNGRAIHILLARFGDEENKKTAYGNCIQVRYMKKPLHAKVLIRDKNTAFVGSFNYTQNSLERNREIGFFVSGVPVKTIVSTFESDWKQAEVALP